MMPTRCVFAMRCTCSRVFNTSSGHTNVAVRAPASAIDRVGGGTHSTYRESLHTRQTLVQQHDQQRQEKERLCVPWVCFQATLIAGCCVNRGTGGWRPRQLHCYTHQPTAASVHVVEAVCACAVAMWRYCLHAHTRCGWCVRSSVNPFTPAMAPEKALMISGS